MIFIIITVSYCCCCCCIELKFTSHLQIVVNLCTALFAEVGGFVIRLPGTIKNNLAYNVTVSM